MARLPAFNGTTSEAGGPFAVLAAEHQLQLELCDCLEQLADSLPDRLDRVTVAPLCLLISRDVTDHFAWEEQILFPAMRRRAMAAASVLPMLHQLESEHARDEDQAHEIAEALAGLAGKGTSGNAEMLGYMLRGFFEGQRRHISWEDRLLLPIARELLTASDLRDMARASALPERLERARSGRLMLQRVAAGLR